MHETAQVLTFTVYYILAGAAAAFGATFMFAGLYLMADKYQKWRKRTPHPLSGEVRSGGMPMLRRPTVFVVAKAASWPRLFVRVLGVLAALMCVAILVAVFQAM